MKQDYQVFFEKEGEYNIAIIVYCYENENILLGMNFNIHKVITKYNIDPVKIEEILTRRENFKRIIRIKYRKI